MFGRVVQDIQVADGPAMLVHSKFLLTSERRHLLGLTEIVCLLESLHFDVACLVFHWVPGLRLLRIIVLNPVLGDVKVHFLEDDGALHQLLLRLFHLPLLLFFHQYLQP